MALGEHGGGNFGRRRGGMACGACGHDSRHDGKCLVYEPLIGWCVCEEYEPGPGSVSAAVHFAGRASARGFYNDTKAFRDKSVAAAAKKGRR